MKFVESASSKKALAQIKEQMIKQYNDNDNKRFKVKFTKKKEFVAVPIPYTGPAFQLYINGKFLQTYFLKKEKWTVL